MHKRVFLALLALAVLATPAQAQGLSSEISVTADSPGVVAWNGTAPLNVTVEVGCGIFAADPSASELVVSATTENDTLTASTETIAIAASDCLAGGGAITKDVVLTMTPAEDAPGIVTIPIAVTAMVGTASGEGETSATVSYKADHQIIPDVTFPLTVDNGTVTFNVTIVYAANAPSMVMFEEQSFDNGGSIKGLKPVIETPPAEVVLPVTFKAPSGDWNQTTLSFRNFSHYIFTDTGLAGDPELEKIVEWTFVQGASETPATEEGDKDSPGAGVLVALGLFALAFVARRK